MVSVFLRLPFDWKTPYGYMIAFFIEFGTFYYILVISACYLSFLSGACETLISFAVDLKSEINGLNGNLEMNDNSMNIHRRVFDIVEFHSTLMQFTHDFIIIYNVMIPSHLFYALTTICNSLLMVQTKLVELNYLIFIQKTCFPIIF